MLRDLTIQNYRTFKDFHIDGLARVNLIVGMNNTGKTSLLEAIYLLVNQGGPQYLADVLYHRGEVVDQSNLGIFGETQGNHFGYQIRHLFYGYLYDNEPITNRVIKFCSQTDYDSLQVSIELRNRDFTSLPNPDPTNPSIFEIVLSFGSNKVVIVIPVNYDGSIGSIQFQPIISPNNFLNFSHLSSFFLTTSNLSFEKLAALWSRITLTPKEDKVIDAMRILEPKLERINFTQPSFNSGILVRLRGQYPIPLGVMGEGMRRILTLAIAAVTVENGFLLIDEIDTGLHYQTQTDMWRLVIEVAKQLNVQVFATTHSWDCITAFQEALAQSEDSSVGKLFRLSRQEENIRAVEYTPDELSIAVRQSIEVR